MSLPGVSVTDIVTIFKLIATVFAVPIYPQTTVRVLARNLGRRLWCFHGALSS